MTPPSTWFGHYAFPFPVGAIFLSAVSTNPATLLGYGTWSQVAQGQLLAGFKAGDAAFGTLGGTGGAKTATLTTNELPAHTHGVTDGGHTHVERIINSGTAGTVGVQGASAASNADASNSPSKSNTTGLTVNSAGSGAAFSILPPYLVVYVWQRTA